MKMSNSTIATTGACLTLLFSIAILLRNFSGDSPGSSIRLPMSVSKTRLSFTSIFHKIGIIFIAIRRLVYYPSYRGFHQMLQSRAMINEGETTTVKVKTLYFIRHGKSVWNDVGSNRNPFVVLFKSVRLLVFEIFLLFTNEALLFDSPLSPEGISQSLNVAQFLSSPKNQNDPDIAILNGKSPVPSVLFTSFLRRSQGTMALVLQSRLTSNDENIYVTHELDEVVRNPDCVSMHLVFNSITFPLLEQLFSPQSYYRYLRMRLVENDPVELRNPFCKLMKFFDRVFQKFDEDVVIAVGHSRWIKYAMRLFFPPNSVDHDILNNKLTNTGIVRVDVHLKKNFNGDHLYVFDPKSFRIIYGSFS